jgi:hypothetical protein
MLKNLSGSFPISFHLFLHGLKTPLHPLYRGDLSSIPYSVGPTRKPLLPTRSSCLFCWSPSAVAARTCRARRLLRISRRPPGEGRHRAPQCGRVQCGWASVAERWVRRFDGRGGCDAPAAAPREPCQPWWFSISGDGVCGCGGEEADADAEAPSLEQRSRRCLPQLRASPVSSRSLAMMSRTTRLLMGGGGGAGEEVAHTCLRGGENDS